VVPYEERFLAAEEAQQAPFDFATGSAGLQAIEAVADRIVALETGSAA
jgi:hypothetical protein